MCGGGLRCKLNDGERVLVVDMKASSEGDAGSSRGLGTGAAGKQLVDFT